MSRKTGVYVIANRIDGKKYVGSASASIVKRWNDHRRDLTNGRHHSVHLQRAWDKHGESAFSFQVLVFCDPKQCVALEQLWMNCFRASERKHGYNISPTAGSTRGKLHTEASIEKMRQAHRGKKQSAEWVSKRAASMRNRGTKRKSPPARSQEHRNNLSSALKGKPVSDDHRKKLACRANERYADKRVMVNGEFRNLKSVCLEVGLKYTTVWARIKKGWTVESAISTMAGGGAEGGM
jgi:group I intron endonuclease